MPWLLLIALLGPPIAGDWIGTVAFHDSRGDVVGPVLVTLLVTEAGAVSGQWRGAKVQSSGAIVGTVHDGRFHLTITFYGGADITTAQGQTETVALERCKSDADFTGALLPTGIIRLTTKRVIFDNPVKRARHTDCEDLTNVTWLLQPAAH